MKEITKAVINNAGAILLNRIFLLNINDVFDDYHQDDIHDSLR